VNGHPTVKSADDILESIAGRCNEINPSGH
jgi:hypothetical protein